MDGEGGRRRPGRGGGAAWRAALSVRGASGMQRPEAWPRPHPGEGATAAQAEVVAPPAGAGEPTGQRVGSARVRDPGWRELGGERPPTQQLGRGR